MGVSHGACRVPTHIRGGGFSQDAYGGPVFAPQIGVPFHSYRRGHLSPDALWERLQVLSDRSPKQRKADIAKLMSVVEGRAEVDPGRRDFCF